MPKISVGACVSFGWKTFKSRPWFFVGVGIIVFLVQIALNAVTKLPLGFVVSLIGSVLLSMGLTALYLKAHDAAGAASFKDLWHPNGFLKFLGAYLLVVIAITIGLILLVIPGIIVSLMLMFAMYLVIDRGLGPINSLKESFRLTKGNLLNLFLLALAIFGLNLIGTILLFVGLLVTIPISLLAITHAYRTLSGATSAASVSAPAPEGAPVVPAAM